MQVLKEQAFKAEVAFERRQEAKRRAKQEEVANRKREQLRIQNALLEAAFDDELDEVQSLLQEAQQYFDDAVRNHTFRLLAQSCHQTHC